MHRGFSLGMGRAEDRFRLGGTLNREIDHVKRTYGVS
jgi:hypothetical protein